MPNQIRQINEPPEIRWAGDRSLLLIIRMPMQVLRTDPNIAEDLLALTHADARQIIEDPT